MKFNHPPLKKYYLLPVTVVSIVLNKPKILVVLTSTVETLSILPFFTAVAIEASPLKGILNIKVAFDIPVLVASLFELLVAVNGIVTEQLVIKNKNVKRPIEIKNFFIKI